MRTKDEILSCVIKDVKTSRNLLEMEHVTDVPLLEVLIDLRDIHEGILGFLATYYEDGITPK